MHHGLFSVNFFPGDESSPRLNVLGIPCSHSGSCKAQGFWGFCVGYVLVNIYKQLELPTLVPETYRLLISQPLHEK